MTTVRAASGSAGKTAGAVTMSTPPTAAPTANGGEHRDAAVIEMTGSLLGNERGDHPGEGAGEIGGGHRRAETAHRGTLESHAQRGDHDQNQLCGHRSAGRERAPTRR